MLIRYTAYLQILNRFLKKIDEKDIKEFADRIWKTRVWLIGNGGSCSLASHMSEDLCKSAKVKAVAISDSPLITASGNDCGYENSFKTGLDVLAQLGDAVIGISVSGESKNIIEVFRTEKGLKNLSFVGVKNSTIAKLSDFCISVGSSDYKLVEDAHLVIAHRIVAEIEWRQSK